MKIINVTKKKTRFKTRLSGDIELKNGKVHTVFFEVDKKYDSFVSNDADAFIAAALGISMQREETLEVEGKVSSQLMKNTPKIEKILQSWNEGFHPVSVLPNNFRNSTSGKKNIGCFFSGGADSFYTYLKNKNKITHMIFVHGFDIGLQNTKLFNKVNKNIISIANKEKVKLIHVKTNVRELFEIYFDWDLSHEFAVASVALFFGNGFKEIFSSCGLPNKNTDHHYMTPEIDALWATETMSIHHFGCEANKEDKLKYLSNNQAAMENLRVCWLNKNGRYNCSECEKCFRNMLGLYVSDSLKKCKTFDKELNLELLKKTRVSEYTLKYFSAILNSLRANNDVSAVRFALEDFFVFNTTTSVRRKMYYSAREFARNLDKKYNKNRLYWTLAKRGYI